MLSTEQIIDKTNELGAHNYHPKDVVIVDAKSDILQLAEELVAMKPKEVDYNDLLSF